LKEEAYVDAATNPNEKVVTLLLSTWRRRPYVTVDADSKEKVNDLKEEAPVPLSPI